MADLSKTFMNITPDPVSRSVVLPANYGDYLLVFALGSTAASQGGIPLVLPTDALELGDIGDPSISADGLREDGDTRADWDMDTRTLRLNGENFSLVCLVGYKASLEAPAITALSNDTTLAQIEQLDLSEVDGIAWKGLFYAKDESDTTSAASEGNTIVDMNGLRFFTAMRLDDIIAVESIADDAPANPTMGAAYLISNAPQGTFANKANNIAVWTRWEWIYLPPRIGKLLYIKALDGYKRYSNNGAWEDGFGSFTLTAASVKPSNLLYQSNVIVHGIHNSPPANPAVGQSFIIGTTPTGVFQNKAHQIALRTNSGYEYTMPTEGMEVYDVTNTRSRRWNGTAWIAFLAENPIVKNQIIELEASQFTIDVNKAWAVFFAKQLSAVGTDVNFFEIELRDIVINATVDSNDGNITQMNPRAVNIQLHRGGTRANDILLVSNIANAVSYKVRRNRWYLPNPYHVNNAFSFIPEPGFEDRRMIFPVSSVTGGFNLAFWCRDTSQGASNGQITRIDSASGQLVVKEIASS